MTILIKRFNRPVNSLTGDQYPCRPFHITWFHRYWSRLLHKTKIEINMDPFIGGILQDNSLAGERIA